jgi:hypothetical protein
MKVEKIVSQDGSEASEARKKSACRSSPGPYGGGDAPLTSEKAAEEGIRAALIDSFLAIDKELFKKGSAKDKGTTAVVALVGPRHLWVANCGKAVSPLNFAHHHDMVGMVLL